MSYSILIYKEKNADTPIGEIHFSGHKTYRNIYLPLIKVLQLYLLEKFDYGVLISFEEVPLLIEEFGKLKNAMRNESDLNRFDFIINELKSLDKEKYECLYLG